MKYTRAKRVLELMRAAVKSKRIKLESFNPTKPEPIKSMFLTPKGIKRHTINVKKPCLSRWEETHSMFLGVSFF